MEYIKLFIIGSFGYLLSGLFDVALLHKKSMLKNILYVGFFVTAIPYIMLFFSFRTPLQLITSWIVLLLLLPFLALLVYSVFIEIVLFSKKSANLYQKGTYSLSRHPGFIWYTIINILIGIYFSDYKIALLCLGLTIDNLILIAIEDTIIFPRLFTEYREYKKKTPFIVSIQSLRKWKGLI